MKKETLKRANELQDRIDSLHDVSYTTSGRRCGDNLESQTIPYDQEFKLFLTSSDAEKLRAHIQKFVVSLRKELQVAFDNLK